MNAWDFAKIFARTIFFREWDWNLVLLHIHVGLPFYLDSFFSVNQTF